MYNISVNILSTGGIKLVNIYKHLYLQHARIYEIPQDQYGSDTVPTYQVLVYAYGGNKQNRYNYFAYYRCKNNGSVYDNCGEIPEQDFRFVAVRIGYCITKKDIDNILQVDKKWNFNGGFIMSPNYGPICYDDDNKYKQDFI
uniref:Uncharacterized protein n=1 Tax=Clastoptera arizonana TaxID=38151 RepID=A0A1B6CAF4_9HEMI